MNHVVTVLSLVVGASLVYSVVMLRLVDFATGVTASLPYLIVLQLLYFSVIKLVLTHVARFCAKEETIARATRAKIDWKAIPAIQAL